MIVKIKSQILRIASNNKANGAAELKKFAALLKEANTQESLVKECLNNPEYKTRIQNAMMRCKKIRISK